MEQKEVMRQIKETGILYNSFQIRSQQEILSGKKDGHFNFPKLSTTQFDDVNRINGYELHEELERNIGLYGIQNCMVVTRSNKRANNFNQQIRIRILWHEDEISAGDLLMIVKNNYTWLSEGSNAGFIANGDTIEILNIRGYEELYGKRFANVICRMIDYPKEPDLEVKIMLDTIMVDGPSLPSKEMKEFFQAVEDDYMEFSNRKQRIKKVLESPYFNALQVKFAYAVTCHKSQGGQWPVVFIDQGYLTDEMMNRDYLRWLYTAITRAQEKVYLINFHKNFFPEEIED
jgi:exodeoxyribonuclease-5